MMRIDSCRKCGGVLEENKRCHICNKVNEFFCHRCSNATDKQIHFDCMMKNVLITA